MKKALITGITGQDGLYLTQLLLDKGYEVHGIKRRSSQFNTQRLDHLYQDPHEENLRLILHYGDLTDATNLLRIIQEVQPDEIYNLGAMSHVRVSFEMPEYTTDVNATGTLRLLEAIRILGLQNKTRFYQASTSEIYGNSKSDFQNESTPFQPRSPYGIAKLYAYWMTINYRESHGLFASNGILFNHESPFRGETFVTKKISRAVASMALGIQDCLYLGNLDAVRDWGHAKDYVKGMWRMLQYDKPDDFVLATGKTYSVREFLGFCLEDIGIQISYQGSGTEEIGKVEENTGPYKKIQPGQVILKVDPRYYRPTEVDYLCGDASKANKELNWQPNYDIKSLSKEMLEFDIKTLKESLS